MGGGGGGEGQYISFNRKGGDLTRGLLLVSQLPLTFDNVVRQN